MRLTRARPTRRLVTLVERAAAEEEEAREEDEPPGDSTALCGEGGSVLSMLRTIDADHLYDK